MKQKTEITQYKKMTDTPIPQLIITLSVPSIISMLINNIYNLVDTAFVGQLGTSASGAVGVVFGFMAIIQAFGFMFGQGSGSILSRALGRRDKESASVHASAGFFGAMLCGLLITLVGFLWLDDIVMLLGSTDTIAPYARTYISYILAAAPFMSGSLALNNVLRYEGKASLGMVGLMSGAILNMIGDPILMFGLNMGIAGAGLSTAVSQVVSWLILVYMFFSGKTESRLSFEKAAHAGGMVYGNIMATGFPSLLRQGLNSLTTVLLNSQCAVYGDAAVAGMSIVSRIIFFTFSIALGIGQGFQPVSAFNYGAGRYSRVRKGFRFTALVAEGIIVVGCALLIGFSGGLIALFRDDPAVIEVGTRALRLQALANLLLPICMAIEMLLQSTGKRFSASFISALRSGLIFIPLLFLLSHLRGLAGIQEAQPLSLVISLPLTIPFAVYYFRKLPKEDEMSQERFGAEEVLRHFKEICKIPHGSGNTKQISDYCVRFAKERGLSYIQDESNNVVIFKDGTAGYEQSAPVIVQGHMDMVCEKTPDCAIDFEKDGLALRIEDGVISAEGTTLGGDDGIAVAMALAILDSDRIEHPPLEVVFTVDEEIGMLGAAALDCTPLKSRILLNLDSEDEGVLLVSCAGGVSAVCRLPISRRETSGMSAVLKISGLAGGHSGVEIDKGRANANQLIGRALNELGKRISYALESVSGGLKDNAIPREATARLVVAPKDGLALRTFAEEFGAIFASEFHAVEPGLTLTAVLGEEGRYWAMDEDSRRRAVAALVNLPGGVLRMSADIPGLVQTSLNMGILKTEDAEMLMSFSVRSSVGTEKAEVVSRLENLMEMLGGTVECMGDYPAWEYRPDSRLRELMIEVFEQQYGRKPRVEAIHAGLECGLFAGKLPGLDCVSFGPDIKDIHTTSETMEIASVQRTWNYVLEVLKRLK